MATATNQTDPKAETPSHSRHLKSFAPKRSIYCSNYPSENAEDILKEHFSYYGEVRKVKVMPHFAFLEFSLQHVIPKVLAEKHVINGKRLKVEPPRKGSIQNNSTLVFAEALNLISECERVSEQIETYVNRISLNHEDYEGRAFAQLEIQNLLKPFYPNCQLHKFGSTMNGFGVHGADMDLLFVPSPGYFEQIHLPKDETIIDLKSFKGSFENLVKLPRYKQLEFLISVFRKSKAIIFPRLISATVAIITFTFQKYDVQFQCDISCSNMLPVYNSRLLKLFSQLDDRVKPFLIILKQWAKSSSIMKKGSMSTYAFQMMAIFFLQNTKPQIVPAVEEMMSRSKESRIVESYETAFDERIKDYPLSLNRQPVEILLQDFVIFYLNFDYILNIICPRTGLATPKTLLLKGSSMDSGFKDSVLCVQDPFEIRRNLTSHFSREQFEFFLFACRYAQRRYKPNASKSNDMPFGIIPLIKPPEEHVFPKNSDFFIPIEGALISFSFTVSKELNVIVQRYNHRVFDLVSAAILHIFNYALLFDASITDCEITKPTQILNADCHNKVCDAMYSVTEENPANSVHENHPCRCEKSILREVCIEAVVLYNTYEARPNAPPSNVDDLSRQKPLNQDHELSRTLMISNGPLKEAKNFACHVYSRKRKKKSSYYEITLSSESACQNSEYKTLAACLETFMMEKLVELLSDNTEAFCRFLNK